MSLDSLDQLIDKGESILVVRQATAFACIGADCEDTCCAHWDISVDSITLENWRNQPQWSLISPKLRVLAPEEATPDVAAFLTRDSGTGACRFLGEDRLCSFQKNFGHDSLSATCKSYPRQDNKISSITERSLTISCPEAARLMLSSRTTLELIIHHSDTRTGPFYKSIIEHDFPSVAITSKNYMPLRVLALQIIQHRIIRIEDRLILLGLFADSLQKVIDNTQVDAAKEIDCIINQFSQLLQDSRQGELRNLLSKIPSVLDIKIDFIMLLTKVLAPFSRSNKRFDVFFTTLTKLMAGEREGTLDSIEAKYEERRAAYIHEFDKSYVFENYLFNLIFSETFPISSTKPLEHFLHLALKFCILREHIIALCSKDGLPNLSQLIQLFQSFSRMYEHSSLLQDSCIQLMKQVNFTSLPHASILIRE